MHVFRRVARLGSFSAAARELGLSPAATSRQVAALEEHLGATLLQRSTRTVRLTPTGEAFLQRAERVLDEVHAMEEEAGQVGGAVMGLVRLTAGVSFADAVLSPLLCDFLDEQPAVSLDVVLTDEHLDLVGQGIDLAVRVGRLPDSALMARRLGTVEAHLCASPAVAAALGPLAGPAELARAPAVIDANLGPRWPLVGPGGELQTVPVEGRLRVNSPRAVCEAARRGLGVALVPDFVAAGPIADGALVPLLPGWSGAAGGVYAVWPPSRRMSAAVRALIQFLGRRLGADGST